MRKAILLALLLLSGSAHAGDSPLITSTVIDGAGTLGPGVYQLQVGVRYSIRVHVAPISAPHIVAGVEPNPDYPTPASANLHNGFNTAVTIDSERDFFYTITPAAMGVYPVGFRMHAAPAGADPGRSFNPAPPLQIHAVSLQPGLFGWVRSQATGQGIPGATVKRGAVTTTTDANGKYQLPPAAGNLLVSKPNYSDVVVMNLPSPAGGVRADVSMEESFPALNGTGISYLSYLDYSHGRTLFHLVQIDTSLAEIHVEVPPHGSLYVTGKDVAGQSATINGGFFGVTPSDPRDHRDELNKAQGYLYVNGAVWPAYPIAPSGTGPMLTLKGSTYDMVDSPLNLAGIVPNFDAAIQCGPWLIKDGIVQANPGGDQTRFWARTTIGLGGKFVYFVVADGEGNPGSAGATQDQLAAFYHDVLHASKAMELDGGGSTQLVLPGAGGLRFVNALTGEDNEYNHATDGRVLSFVSARKRGTLLPCSGACAAGSYCASGRCLKCPTPKCQQP